MLTLKFGGTSMGSAQRILDSVEIMIGRANKDRISVVVSAVAGVSNKLQEAIDACVSGQTPDLAPADKILYALRDVTGTVDSIPLIASSIMSKKIAGGAKGIVLDVTCGSGAFMKDYDMAKELAEAMIRIGKLAGRKTVAVITNMDEPLGRFCGNILEMQEVLNTVTGKGEDDVVEVVTELAYHLITIAGKDAGMSLKITAACVKKPK